MGVSQGDMDGGGRGKGRSDEGGKKEREKERERKSQRDGLVDTYVQVFPSLVRTADLVTTQATCSRCSLFSNSCSSSSSITAIAHCHRLGLLLATRATTVSGRCALRLGPKCALTHWQLTARVPSLFFGTQAPRGKAKSQSPAPIIPITRNEPPLPLILSLLVLNTLFIIIIIIIPVICMQYNHPS